MAPSSTAPSPRQLEVFAYLFRHTLQHGYQPSLTEIGDDLGIKTRAALLVYLGALQAKGWLAVPDNPDRRIRFLRNLDGSPFSGLAPAPVGDSIDGSESEGV